jgi:hypothetical protein
MADGAGTFQRNVAGMSDDAGPRGQGPAARVVWRGWGDYSSAGSPAASVIRSKDARVVT